MWFWLSLAALICWSGSDLFSKIGCRDNDDKNSHLKMVTAVGVVMGIHALYEIFIGGTQITLDIMLKYLPVSMLYILSMTIGYVCLRYIELSVSSPICNCSGALVAITSVIAFGLTINGWQIAAIVLVCIGVIGLGFVEHFEDDELRALRQEKSNYKYSKSALALLLPLGYCVLDAAGTFADNLVLETLNEDSANVAYELTFLFCGIISFIYLKLFKKAKFLPKREAPKYIGACFETAGQFAYIYAIADSEHLVFSAPIISAYCLASVVWSRIFLKERLSYKHYIMIALAIIGIVIIGLFDEIG